MHYAAKRMRLNCWRSARSKVNQLEPPLLLNCMIQKDDPRFSSG